MKFNVLDRSLNIHQHTLLEASAGTGKTFSIEHLVVRFLIEERLLNEILVVTFTRAATRDLKQRIQENIRKVLVDLNNQQTSFDYLQALIEKGEEAVSQAKCRLENALFNFDQAQITTIHSFCLRMLTDFGFAANFNIDMPESENSFSNTEILQIVHDYFRTELSKFRPSQLELILKKFSIEKLEEFLLQIILNGKEIEEQQGDEELFFRFQNVMARLKNFGFTYEEEVAHFKELCNKNGVIKPEIQDKLEGFQKLLRQDRWIEEDFDWLITDQLSILKIFHKDKLKSKGEDRKRDFFNAVKEELYPLIHEHIFLAKLASDCHKKVKRHLKQVEKFRFDDLLRMMREALEHPQFIQAVRSQYRIAIIDEFQDTDPLQWSIFRDLFLTQEKLLILVGDPKQSIYAFRQADIYTYLEAARAIGKDHLASLDTNYRSQPALINALNALFSKSDFLKLPRLRKSLQYRPVEASPKASSHFFKDDKGALHFSLLESGSLEKMETEYFPFIVQEIQQLTTKEGMHDEQMAILVADRFQAERLSCFLSQWKIPCVIQKQKSLVNSTAYSAIKELLQSVIKPRNLGLVKQALGSEIFGWTHLEIQMIEPVTVLEWFNGFHEILFNEGFAIFFEKLMKFKEKEEAISERILSREEGEAFYNELYQIAELLIVARTQPDELLEQLDEFQLWSFNEDDRIKKRNEKGRKAINIITIHSSKGLEFDVVFVLGLLKKGKLPDYFYPVTIQEQTFYKPILDEACESFQNYCQEMDAEKMRQLYVAMTRAKYRVYAPVAMGRPKQALGISSPMEIFFNFPIEELQSIPEITCSTLTPQPLYTLKGDDEVNLIQEPEPVYIQNESERIGSFTALAKKIDYSKDWLYPTDFLSEEKNAHSLPVGSKTGNLLHKLLENLPFSLPLEGYMTYIQPYVKKTPYQAWDNILCGMLHQALHTPLTLDEPFRLIDVNPNELIREMEFLYQNSTIYIKGFVDLIFRHRGKYYVLDWKTNWLGPALEFYNRDNMEKCMKENDYFLQGHLYSQALKKYLSLVELKPFNEVFGGVYYVFLRGLSQKTGIFHFWPEHG